MNDKLGRGLRSDKTNERSQPAKIEGVPTPANASRSKQSDRAKPVGGPDSRPGRPVIEEQIGRHLRAVYEDVLAQPIPDRFLSLIEQLGSSDVETKEKGEAGDKT